MADENKEEEKPLVERWLEDQQEWQKTMLNYMDSMASNEDFLVHLGNAMRGSLLAGKPYPGSTPPAGAAETDAEEAGQDARLDRILFSLHEIQGQLNDLHLTVERLAARIDEETAGPHSEAAGDVADAVERAAATATKSGERPLRGRLARDAGPAPDSKRLRRSQPRANSRSKRGESD